LSRSAQSGALLRSHMQADMMHDALRADVLSVLASSDPAMGVALDAARADLAEHTAEFRKALKESTGLASAPAVRAALGRLDAPLDDYIKAAGEIAELQAADPAAAKARLADFKTRFDTLEVAMGEASDKIEVVANADAADAEKLSLLGRTLMAAAVGLALLFGVGLVVLALRSVVAPIKALAEDMRRLAGGETDLKLQGANRRDEVGDIGRAVRDFQDVIVAKARAEAEETDRRRRAEADAEAAQHAERLAREQALSVVVDGLADGLKRLSSGDLAFRLERAFAPEYERLRADFNEAMVRLEDTLRTIVGAAQAIRSGSGEIGSAADSLSRRTEQQAANLEETAAALDEITATVKASADGAARARSVVAASKDDAEQSSVVVREAVDAMSGIEQSSQQIGQIIGVIDEIAFQTNLLALNAGVEAARAGEAGKGFAVVASEVRALAQRSAEAAKEIKALISASTQQVEQGVDLVGRTGEALQRILKQVTEINGLVATISASAQEQSAGLGQVNAAVNQMDQMTQQNAAMVEESTAATATLNQQVGQLFALVGQFKVSSGGAAVETRAAA
jgi:methyl-accepting chemotaxis protein